MTVPVQTPFKNYVGNGVTTEFAVGFLCLEGQDLAVYLNGVKASPLTYTVANLNADTGGTVTFNMAPGVGVAIFFNLEVVAERDIDYKDLGDLFAETLNFDFDRIWLAIQSAFGGLARALRLGPTDVDGAGSYRANQNRIQDVRDAEADQDAVNKRVMEAYVNNSIAGVEGGYGFYHAPGAGAVNRNFQDVFDDNIYVESYGAAGDGVTNDAEAFRAMHNALGYIRLQRKTYYVGTFILIDSQISIIGSGKAAFALDFSRAVDGTGTIVVGTISINADHIYLSDFTADVARLPTIQEGFVADARAGAVGLTFLAQRIGSIARPDANASHGLLVQGFNHHTIKDVDIANHNYGVVSKSRGGIISGIRGHNVKTCVVNVKGSLPANAGNVADGSAANVDVSDVHGYGGTTGAGCGVWVYADGTNVSAVRVRGVYYQGGLAAVYVLAGTANPYVDDLQISDVCGVQNSYAAVAVTGATFDMQIHGVVANNPATGAAIAIDTNSVNWNIDGVHLLISDPAISGVDALNVHGTGQWDNINVRKGSGNMRIQLDWVNQRTGKKFGNVDILGDGQMTLSNGAALVAGEQPPLVKVGTDNMICLGGVVSVAGVTTTGKFATMPTGIVVQGSRFFICAARKTDDTYTSFPVYVSSNEVWLFGVPTGIKWIYLDGIVVRR